MNDTKKSKPVHIDLKKDNGLTIQWSDGRVSFYPITHLRKWSPSADARALRDEMASNPLTVLPATVADHAGESITATDIEMIGNYAIRIIFSDGHDTGIYSWEYLKQIEPKVG